jgi:CelD/BcsL family acetyltransferase involved in cellulose biosynthesis
MDSFWIDPNRDPRWAQLVKRHSSASVFHSREWLEALRSTYGYQCIALTASAPNQDLENGMVFCAVHSWLTGRRLISLPFSDHCQPLVQGTANLQDLLDSVVRDGKSEQWKFIEIRPSTSFSDNTANFHAAESFFLHKLDLRMSASELFRSFHKDSIQRKIRRAERERLTCEVGRTESLLDKFYTLLLSTRRRHHLPPHPRAWFRNLANCMGDRLKVRVASHQGQPVASILTLHFKDTLVYKYGCSDAAFHSLGGMHLLFWQAIEEAKAEGLTQMDLGRTDADNEGLATFKERWGATRTSSRYWRFPLTRARAARGTWQLGIAKQIFAHVPDRILTAAGELLYKHVG